jgi:hypothetical protein
LAEHEAGFVTKPTLAMRREKSNLNNKTDSEIGRPPLITVTKPQKIANAHYKWPSSWVTVVAMTTPDSD